MIPKVIHYCWFGGKPKPKLAKKCIKSWKKHLPDYVLKEWNEQNFDINSNRYVKEAYEARKYAFVTDYVRLYALFLEGGIYMDTDVEVTASLDEFLHHKAFSGFESNEYVPTGIMASEKNGAWCAEQLRYYDNAVFINADGAMNTTTNTETITNSMKAKGLRMDNTYQELPGLIAFYPSDYFCPKSWKTGEIHLTERTHTIHHFSASWWVDNNLTKTQKIRRFWRNRFHDILHFMSLDQRYVCWRQNKMKECGKK